MGYKNLKDVLLKNHFDISENKEECQNNMIITLHTIFQDNKNDFPKYYEMVVTFVNVLSPFSIICMNEEV